MSVRVPGTARRLARGAVPAGRRAPRRGARRTVLGVMRDIPRYLRLLAGLIADSRVSTVDKLLVGGAIAYILMPLDLIPDFTPFLGQVDDVYLLVVSLQRLIGRAGRDVVSDHWDGDLAALTAGHLRRVLLAAAFFLPRRIRRRLRRIG